MQIYWLGEDVEYKNFQYYWLNLLILDTASRADYSTKYVFGASFPDGPANERGRKRQNECGGDLIEDHGDTANEGEN